MIKERILITGGAGFIGSHIVEHIYKHTDWDIVIIDKLSYASKGLARLKHAELIDVDRVSIFTYDLTLPITQGLVSEIGDVTFIIHMAAETHVDNSISTPGPFIHNNIMSTVNILEYSRRQSSLKRFFYFSTDEIYGSAPENVAYKENDPHNPTNPYSASKSASEMICVAYENTYKIPLVITNLMNVFGERQHVEKFIPKCIKYILKGKMIKIHADKTCTIPGKRHYIHGRNVASAILFLVFNAVNGERYNIVGEKELNNLELAQLIAEIMGKELKFELVNFHEKRAGHDLVYRLSGEKLLKLGWSPPKGFEDSLKKTVLWTLEHKEWLDK
jgi:dTDP-glucose 4,6-dehydratase